MSRWFIVSVSAGINAITHRIGHSLAHLTP